MKEKRKIWNYVELSSMNPFSVSFENTTDEEIKNIICFDALSNANNSANNYGLPLGIVPIYNIPSLSYNQFLNYLLSASPRIRKIYTICNNMPTLRAEFEIKSYNMQGDSLSKLIRPVFNTFQNIEDQIDTPVDFYLTGATKITISSIAPKTMINFQFYPMTYSDILKERKKLNYYNIFISFIKNIFKKHVSKHIKLK